MYKIGEKTIRIKERKGRGRSHALLSRRRQRQSRSAEPLAATGLKKLWGAELFISFDTEAGKFLLDTCAQQSHLFLKGSCPHFALPLWHSNSTWNMDAVLLRQSVRWQNHGQATWKAEIHTDLVAIGVECDTFSKASNWSLGSFTSRAGGPPCCVHNYHRGSVLPCPGSMWSRLAQKPWTWSNSVVGHLRTQDSRKVTENGSSLECKQDFFQEFRVITNLLTVKYYLSRPRNAVTQINPEAVKLGVQPKNVRARRLRKAIKVFL